METPIHRSNTLKEDEDQGYLDNLIRTARLQRCAASDDNMSLSVPAPAYEVSVHGHSNHHILAPSRTSTPTPPIPKRPTSASITTMLPLYAGSPNELARRASTATLLEINVLDDNYDHHQLQPSDYSQSHNHSLHPSPAQGAASSRKAHQRPHSIYDYGMPVNYRTGANVDDYDSTESDLQGNSVNDVTRPQLARHVRQEKMLKRSSQFRLPVHRRNSPDHSLPHGSQEQGWGQRWRKLSKKLKSKKISSLGVVEPDSNDRSQGVDDHKNNDLSEDEKAKLKALIQKKKLSHDQLLDVNVDASQHMDRPRSCMSLAWVTVLICMFMFLYNGVLSVLVFQASRFPNVDTSVPIFALGLLLVFTAILPIFGLWACWLLVRSYRSSSNSPSSSRRPQMLFKIFHLLYFFTAFVIFGCMLGWLGLNKIQTGSWDRMSLKASSLLESSPTGSPLILKFESILRPDPIDPDMWIINPIIWIVSFATIWLTQVYSWYRLVAFAKKMRRETIK